MKSFILFIIAFAMSANFMVSSPVNNENTKPDTSQILSRAAIVVGLDLENDTVTLEDAVGFIWQFYGCEDWCIGDVAIATIWDCNGTPETILDDHIIDVIYSGYTIGDFVYG